MDILSNLFVKGDQALVPRLSWQAWSSNALKRSFDIVVALIGLIMLAPIFLLVAVSIRLNSPGPVFYRGPRLGCGGRVFGILKFRTMYECPESYQGPRITARRCASPANNGFGL
jgi:lipopolysaccharide/colanic/teichoic acid biosynthesis glycosyltransferase